MLISCPKCNTVYQIKKEKIPQNGKKFKCAECGEIWTVMPEDLNDENPETVPTKPQIVLPDNQLGTNSFDKNNMFDRISANTKYLFSDQQTTSGIRDKIKNKFNLWLTPVNTISTLLSIIIVFSLMISYFNRYEIVGFIPNMEKFYEMFQIESIYYGKGLKFGDIKVKSTGRGKESVLEISGFVQNSNNVRVGTLPIKATIYNENGSLDSVNTKILTMKKVPAGYTSLFRMIIPDNSIRERKLIMSFDRDGAINGSAEDTSESSSDIEVKK